MPTVISSDLRANLLSRHFSITGLKSKNWTTRGVRQMAGQTFSPWQRYLTFTSIVLVNIVVLFIVVIFGKTDWNTMMLPWLNTQNEYSSASISFYSFFGFVWCFAVCLLNRGWKQDLCSQQSRTASTGPLYVLLSFCITWKRHEMVIFTGLIHSQ